MVGILRMAAISGRARTRLQWTPLQHHPDGVLPSYDRGRILRALAPERAAPDGRAPNNVWSWGTVLGEPAAVELSYQLSCPGSLWQV